MVGRKYYIHIHTIRICVQRFSVPEINEIKFVNSRKNKIKHAIEQVGNTWFRHQKSK